MDNIEGPSLPREEQIVFDIVKEYTKKRAIVEILDLINYVNIRLRSNLEFNKNKIERIIKDLIKKNFILIGAKLVKEDILTLPARKEIFDYIRDNPGTNINEIKDQLGLVLDMVNNVTIVQNTFLNNQKGIQVGWSDSNLFYMNNFTGNQIHAVYNGNYNLWDNGSIGNYWDDYIGIDSNNDGIGDSGTGNLYLFNFRGRHFT